MASLLIVWVLFMNTLKVMNVYSSIIKTPQLGLRVSVTPKTGIFSGDTVQYSFEVSHTKKSFADALDIEIQILCPAFLVFGNHTVKSSSIRASNETKSDQDMVFKFANITANSHVAVTMDIRVDPYYMLGSRDEVIASSSVKLWYYGELDSCHRPASKWNARSLADTIRFSFGANKVCERAVDQLGESQFSASSFYKPNFHALGNSPHHASFTHDQVWTPADTMTKDIHQYLQIKLEQLVRITKIATKGNGNTYPSSFVRKYVLYHSKDGVHWSMAYAGLKSKEFQANVDSTTVKMNDIRVPIEARLLRIVPKTWKNKITLKVKLFGCLAYHVPAGYQPLGISSSRIRDDQLSVESGNQHTYPPYNARLNLNHGLGGWCTTTGWKQTLVVDLGEDYVITELAVQSQFQATNRLIRAFNLAYKNDGGLKTSIKENGNKKIFLGNPVEDTTIRHRLLESVKARHVYIEPKQMSSNTGCLRIELYGYKEDQVPPSDYCSIFDFENDGLLQWSLTGSAFDNQPTFVDNRHARTGHVVNHEGAWWIGTRENRNTAYSIPGQTQGNYPTGTLTSPGFLISFSKLFFLFAGTANQEKARVELIVDATVVRAAWSGTGNESMVQMSWDVQEFLGREARIRLVDNATDGFVSFDGLKSNCHPTQEKLTVFEKSFLLSPSNNTLYICQFSHSSNPGNTACRLTSDNGQSWHDLSSQVSGLLGVHEVSGKVYGVSRDWRDYLESTDWEGKSWTQINSSIWKRIKQDVALITVVEILHIPVTGLPETDDASQILNLVAQSGDKFAASSRGVHHKPSSGSWTMIATWHCKEYPNICISNPCNNGGVCHVLLDGGFNCTCPQGFTGEICDNTIDDCQNDSCLNGGKCLDGFNKFFCSCNSFFTGARCERNIDDCTASPCGPGASCIDGLGNYTCQCPNGFIGEVCELEIDECASVPCQHGGHCVDEVNSYTCHCRRGYSGTNCEHVHSSGFEVISSRSVQYGISRYLVVHARIPSDGRSLHQTWCQDYTALCYSLNKTRPTGCGRSFSHITDNHLCLTMYESVMDHNDTLGCPPNVRVSLIANLAGYGSSTADNSFAFSQCADNHCTGVLPMSGCHGALSCISQAVINREVYTLCSDSDSDFLVEDKRYTSFKGVNYLALYVRPRTNTARHENWCRDYQRLCQSYGKRPTECGNKNNADSESKQCQKKYFSVMAANNELECENSIVETIGQDAGLPLTSHHIIFHNCSASVYQNCCASGCHKEIPSCGEMSCLNDTNLALCTEPQTSFTVLDERRTMSNNISWLIIKAKLPRDRKSTQENWCRDYSTLCESYGLHPTGSDVTYDYDYTSCWDNYKSVVIGGDFFGVAPQVKIAELAQRVGFLSATPSNSFALNKCTKCPSVLSSTDCTGIGLGCINPSSDGDVYTVCVEPQTALDVQETKSTVYNNTSYLAVKAKLTGKKKSNLEDWSMEYKKLCLRNGRRALKCNSSFASESLPIELSHHVCHDNGQPDADSLKTIVQKAGFSDATNTNTLIFHSYQEDDPWLNYTVVYTLCHGSDSNFDVISAKVTKYQGLPNLVIKARLPSHGMSRYKDWCEDYKRLCHSYGQRPTGCGGATCTATASYTACRDSYDSLTPEDNIFGCPWNNNIAFLANEIGFTEATINNTFALSLCNDTCSKNISEKDNFISYLNPSEPVYTMCVGSNSSFTVESTKDISYQGGTYKVIKASIPSHMSAKHENWCRDYQKLCESYGLRAVVTSKESDFTCESTYNAIAPRRNELSAPEKLKHLVEMAGYFNSSAENIFAFDKTCQNSCFVNLVDFKSVNESAFYVASGTVAVQNHVVYALCMNSDSNFKVVDSRSLVYQNRSYLVLKTLVPHHGHSKFDNWCLDYQRLCTGYQMRPVTILDTQSYSNMKSCTPDYMSVVVPRNLSSNIVTRDHVSVLANIAGYCKASRDNSFAFRHCDPRQCSRVLTPYCSSGLDCLTDIHREVYTLCTDSDSNFMVEQTRHVSHKGVPYLLIQSRLPEHGLARHKTWCSDYQHLCNSFGMQPTGCGASSNTSGNSRCVVDYQSFVSPIDNIRCGDEAVTTLKEMNDQNSFKGETMFVFKNCENCSKSIFVSKNENKSDPSSCGDALYCLRQNKTVVTICSKLESRFKVLETKQYDYNGDQLTIAKTMLVSDESSSGDNWCYDYEKMCSSLGKRPFSCGFSNDVIQYKHTQQYSAFLSNSGICSSVEMLSSLVIKAGFSLAAQENLLTFINCTTCTEKLKHCSEVVQVPNETTKNCCKCSNTTVNSNNTLVTTLLANTSFSTSWKICIEIKLNKELNQTLNENCSIARDCLNDTLLANNSCELLSKCFHGNCFDCSCNYSRRNTSQPVKEDNVVYTFCSDYSRSNFVVHEVREVEYAGLPYTVLRSQVPSHGYSKSDSWYEDYKKLCESIGKRPVGCGKDAEVIKQSRDCRLLYDAVMLDGMSCPGSQEVADIAVHAGFSASVNQSLGLWKCDECSRNFTDVWNGTNSSSNVYTLCYGSHSNFNVLEKRIVEFHETPVTVVMATVPHDGLSLHKDWCLDYSLLCQSYGLRPVGCGKSRDTVNAHAQCRDRYNAVMFSEDIIDCSEGFNVHSIVQSAGFKQATSSNSFIFNSCLVQHCTKYLPSSQAVEHAFGHLNSTDQVVYTLCVSSSSSYDVIATKSVTVDQQDYLVIRAKIPVDGESKYRNWCQDYQRLCEGYGMRPLSCSSSDSRQRNCMYNYEALTMAASDKSCPITSGVAYIAQQAGFDNVSSTNSFAFDYCDQSTSCVAKIPNIFCWNQTDYDSVFTTVTTQANITRVDFTQFISTATGVNGTEIVNSTVTRYCFIIQDTNPPFTVDGMDIKLILKNFTCEETFNSQTPGYIISYFNMTANQTFENLIPQITRLCRYSSPSSLARVSGEVNTVCLRPSVGTHFLVKSTRKITNSEREYLIIKAELLSSTSKSENWCSDYTNLCQSFGTSPLACPRKYAFNGDYLKCLSNYQAIMMNDVDYSCPSNGFISELGQTAGYQDASLSNSFALFNCGENKCQSKLPLVGCSESLHCLNEQVVHQHVYTACVVANSDSNFHVIEKRKRTINSKQYTVIHSRIPSDGKSLHDNWCLDYQRLCESMDLRPVHCKNGISAEESGLCKEKYSAVSEESKGCPIRVHQIAKTAGFSAANNQNSFSFHRCDSCSRVLTTQCSKSLKCLKSNAPLSEVYTICRDARTETNFAPLATKRIRHGGLGLRVIQAKLRSQHSVNSDWARDYENLCKSYNELPTGCGNPAGEKDPGVYSCGEKYSSYVLPGGELGCDPNDVISKLARDAGFVNASPKNSFGFSSCNGSVSTLSSSCHSYLPCLTWQEMDPIVYTVCIKKLVSNFRVLTTKMVKFRQSDYLVVHAQLPMDGRSLYTDWCVDYQKLCDSYGMRPTGCGGSAIQYSNYSSCSSKYDSYMPASNNLGCGDSKIASRVANKAGYTNSIPGNTFVFHACDQCKSVLADSSQCDIALGCIHNMVWKKEVYTLCVDPTTSFNVVKTATVVHTGTKYLVLGAQLPTNGRAKAENWCREYELLCQFYKKRPVSCERDDHTSECLTKYQSVEQSGLGFSCDSASTVVSQIALNAGFPEATASNSFIFNNCDGRSCSKELPTSGCDPGLSCVHSSIVGNVYTICSEDTSVFRVLPTRKLSVSGHVYTIVPAVFPQDMNSTWCHDYSKLCHLIGQSPVVLSSDVINKDMLECRDEYDGVFLPKEEEFDKDGIHRLAVRAGFRGASYGNTFVFKSCAESSCSVRPRAFNCSHSLHCLNGQSEVVYGICVENTPRNNFYVLETKTVDADNTKYLALKVRVPGHRLSKYESWCRDYERLCHSYNMRPLTTLLSPACQLQYHCLFHKDYHYLSFVNLVQKAGFLNVSSKNLYFLQHCGTNECARTFQLPQCTSGSCSISVTQTRVLYTLCGVLDEDSTTNFEVQDVRNVWFDAAFLVAQVRLPTHRMSKEENWCKEYQTFCESYGRRPYVSTGLSKKEMFATEACYWKYNATSYRQPMSSSAIVQRAGFSPSSVSCTSSLHRCSSCGKVLNCLTCPFENCQAAVETCLDYYIICT